MTQSFKVTERRGAQRCEICHQSDSFDGMTEICESCLQVKKAFADKIAEADTRPEWANVASAILVVFFLMLGIFLASRFNTAIFSGLFFMAWTGVACFILSRKFGISFLD